jgi:hypothetical protein
MQPANKRRWRDDWDSRRIVERHKVAARPKTKPQAILSKNIACELPIEADPVDPPENKQKLPYPNLFNETH